MVKPNSSKPHLDGVFRTNLKDSDPVKVVQIMGPCSQGSTQQCDLLIVSAKQGNLPQEEFELVYDAAGDTQEDVVETVRNGRNL